MRLVNASITLHEIAEEAKKTFGEMVKAVVDIEKRIMVIGGDMHADEEAELIKNGSNQQDLWGINLYPDLTEDLWMEFDSMINVRPLQGNMSRMIQDEATKQKIRVIVDSLVKR